jgi:glycosyltransferase involved in cell wall biosynthesis
VHILIIPSWYPTPARPLNGIFVRQQAEALSKVHEVRVLYLDVLPRGQKQPMRRWMDLKHGFRAEIIEVPNRPLIWQFTYLWYLFRAYRALRSTFQPDIIHCHVAVPAGLGGALLRRLFGVPVVLTEHSSTFDAWLKRPGLRFMAARALAEVDAVIAVSEGQRKLIKRSFPRVRHLQVIPNMVDTALFSPAPFPPTDYSYRLLFVGLMDTPQKGVDILLDALKLVRQHSDVKIHLDLVGDGLLRSQYETQAAQLDLQDVVTFHGVLPNEEVARMLRASHALVLPSRHESQGLAVIEALASGRPVIATRSGGPEYTLDPSNGIVVPPEQPHILASAIIDLLEHLDRYNPQSIGAAARDHYSLRAVVAEITAVYRSLADPLLG